MAKTKAESVKKAADAKAPSTPPKSGKTKAPGAKPKVHASSAKSTGTGSKACKDTLPTEVDVKGKEFWEKYQSKLFAQKPECDVVDSSSTSSDMSKMSDPKIIAKERRLNAAMSKLKSENRELAANSAYIQELQKVGHFCF